MKFTDKLTTYMFQRRDFINKHCFFLLFVMIICLLGHEYVRGMELEGMFKTLLEDKLKHKLNKKLVYVLIGSLFFSICSIINDYKKQNIN